MPKQRPPIPLPPLSVTALTSVQKMEDYARSALAGCDSGMSYNRVKAMRILRTCVVEVVNRQLEYYRSLQNYDLHWVQEIVDTTVDSALGLVHAMYFDHSGARKELFATLADHLEQLKNSKMLGPLTQIENRETANNFGRQLQALLDECRLTAEEAAEVIDISPRSVYRHLAGEARPHKRHLAAYEQAFSKRLQKPVRIEIVRETSGKRHENVNRHINVNKMTEKRRDSI